MKLILGSENTLRVRLTQEEFLSFDETGNIKKSFQLMGDLIVKLQIGTSTLVDQKSPLLSFTKDKNIYDIRLTQEGVAFLKNPSKKGIETEIETEYGSALLSIEVDLKH